MYWREKLASHAWHKGAQRIFEIVNRGRFPVRVGTQKSTRTSAGKNPTFELLSQYIIHAASESIFTWSKTPEWKIVWQVWISRIFADMSQIPNTFCVKATLRRCWRCMEEPPFTLGYELAIRRALREFLQIDKPKVGKTHTHTDLEAKMSMARFFVGMVEGNFESQRAGSPIGFGWFWTESTNGIPIGGVLCFVFLTFGSPVSREWRLPGRIAAWRTTCHHSPDAFCCADFLF